MKKFQNIFKNKKLSFEENAMFFETLSQLISSSIPLIKIFDLINIDLSDKKILENIKQDLINGISLSSAIKNVNCFEDIAIFVVKSGEESGNLKSSFERLSKYYYKLNESKKNIISALFYPIILITSLIFLLLFINYYFIPSLKNLHSYDISKLNFFAQMIFKYSNFTNNYKIPSFIIFFSIISMVYIFIENQYEKQSPIFYKIPLISNIIKSNYLSNILWTYSIMLSSGLDILKSTQIIKQQSNNKLLKEKLSKFSKAISNGKSISLSIKELGFKDEKLYYFISLGEQSGNIDKYIKILSELYTNQLSKDIKQLSQMIQPTLILIISFVLAITISTLILPMINYNNIL